jgi:hypothetical protein
MQKNPSGSSEADIDVQSLPRPVISPNACENYYEGKKKINGVWIFYHLTDSEIEDITEGGNTDPKSGTKTGNISNGKRDVSKKPDAVDILKKIKESPKIVGYSLEGNLSGELLLFALSWTPAGYIKILSGVDRGESAGFTSFSNMGVGLAGASATGQFMAYFYSGDIKHFRIETFSKYSSCINVSVGEGLSDGLNISYLKDKYGGYLIGVGFSFGGGIGALPFSAQWILNNTNIWKK